MKSVKISRWVRLNSRINKKQSRKKKKWVRWVAIVLVAILLVTGGSLYYIWNKIDDTITAMHDPLTRDQDPDRQKELSNIFKENKSINVLLLGVDERAGDKGRSDTIILLSLNPQTNSMAMLSVPRDTYVNIPGRGMDKINHAYAFGDVELSVQTFEEAFQLPVHYYARVNMEGFKQGIDALDGVTIQNDQEFSQGSNQFSKGTVHLNGAQALDYIRMRKNDPRGDLGRNERQRKVITAAIDDLASFSSITKVGNILNILGGNVKTDLDMKSMQTLFTDYRGVRHDVKTLEIDGTGKTLDKWYYMVSDEEFNRIRTEINTHMEAK